MEIKAYAKINLLLCVTGKEASGYHTVETVLQAVSLSDTVTVDSEQGEGITLTCTDPGLLCDETNLARRAAELYRKETGKAQGHIRIHIEKNIPVAGGLAGGSTDAAAVLIALNTFAGDFLDIGALCRLGEKLGADVPFCILADCGVPAALGTHYGEKVRPCPPMPDCTVLIAASGEPVSTPWAYGKVDALPYDKSGEEMLNMHAALLWQSLPAILSRAYNRFEDAILPERPLAEKQKAILLESGAEKTLLSGSGPSMIGFFTGENQAEQAENAKRQIESAGGRAYLCRPITEDMGD